MITDSVEFDSLQSDQRYSEIKVDNASFQSKSSTLLLRRHYLLMDDLFNYPGPEKKS